MGSFKEIILQANKDLRMRNQKLCLICVGKYCRYSKFLKIQCYTDIILFNNSYPHAVDILSPTLLIRKNIFGTIWKNKIPVGTGIKKVRIKLLRQDKSKPF